MAGTGNNLSVYNNGGKDSSSPPLTIQGGTYILGTGANCKILLQNDPIYCENVEMKKQSCRGSHNWSNSGKNYQQVDSNNVGPNNRGIVATPSSFGNISKTSSKPTPIGANRAILDSILKKDDL